MNRERIDRLLEALFRIRPGEAGTALLMFLQCLAGVGAFIVGRSVRDALFLSRGDRASLPFVYILSAVAVALSAWAYGRLVDRMRRDVLTAVTTSTLAAVTLGLRALVGWAEAAPGERVAVYTALYVWVEVFGALVILSFWSFANEIFNSREARRLFGFIGAGGTISSVVVGMSVSGLAAKVGSADLLYLCAALLGAAVVFGWRVAGRVRGRFARVKVAATQRGNRQAIRVRSDSSRIFASPHLRTVAGLVVLTFVVTTLVDFQFKQVARATYAEAELTAFFGRFYAATGALSLFVQLVLTHHLLERFGIVAALAVLPAGLLTGSIAIAVAPVIASAVIAKGADNVFRYTINDATTQLLYLPVPTATRARAKAFIDGILKPGSIALAGLILAGWQKLELGQRPLSAISIAFLVAWGGLLLGLRSRYVSSLRETLRRRRLDLENTRHSIGDESTARVLRRALDSGDVSELLNALQLLPHVPGTDFDPDVARHVGHGDPRVRRAALQHLALRGNLRFGADVLRRFDDPDPAVRSAAIRAFCAMSRDKALRSVRSFLQSPDPSVQAAAIAGMIRFGGLDGVLAAGDALKQLLGSQDPARRALAANILGEIGVRNFYQPLLELIADPDPRVRREAIAAAGQLRSPELVPALVYRLGSDDTATDAVSALVSYGPSVQPTLAKVLANEREVRGVRRNVPRVLAQLADGTSVQILGAHLHERDEELRRRVYRALVRVLRRRPELKVDRREVEAALTRELRHAYLSLSAAEALDLKRGPPPAQRRGADGAAYLLASAIDEEVSQAIARAFLLLQVLHPGADLEVAEAALHGDNPGLRANALELIDNVLTGETKDRLLPLLDDTPRDDKLRTAAGWLTEAARSPEAWLEWLLEDDSAWVQACAASYAGQAGLQAARGAIFARLRSAEPLVREAAAAALAQLAGRDELPQLLEPLRADPADPVRRLIEALLSPRPARSETGA